jgi:hypothetical protein
MLSSEMPGHDDLRRNTLLVRVRVTGHFFQMTFRFPFALPKMAGRWAKYP